MTTIGEHEYKLLKFCVWLAAISSGILIGLIAEIVKGNIAWII